MKPRASGEVFKAGATPGLCKIGCSTGSVSIEIAVVRSEKEAVDVGRRDEYLHVNANSARCGIARQRPTHVQVVFLFSKRRCSLVEAALRREDCSSLLSFSFLLSVTMRGEIFVGFASLLSCVYHVFFMLQYNAQQ